LDGAKKIKTDGAFANLRRLPSHYLPIHPGGQSWRASTSSSAGLFVLLHSPGTGKPKA